jgi:hypothetical protein
MDELCRHKVEGLMERLKSYIGRPARKSHVSGAFETLASELFVR